MASILAPSRGKALSKAFSTAAASPSSLPSILPASTMTTTIASPSRFASARRQFSTTQGRPSKLGITPLSIPPGVEVVMGEPKAFRSTTSYKPVVKKKITVKGPLGGFSFLPICCVWIWKTRRIVQVRIWADKCMRVWRTRNTGYGRARVCRPGSERPREDCDAQRERSERERAERDVGYVFLSLLSLILQPPSSWLAYIGCP